VDNSGGVYVTDPDNSRVIKFSSTGGVQVAWGVNGTGASALNQPTGLAIDKTGAIFLADSGNNRVVRYDPIK
jgi:DNA-binding beta-propeller fold protein YncE